MTRYETVIKWLKEFGLEITQTSKHWTNWHETVIKDKLGKHRTFEITNNHIWYLGRSDRISLGKTKTELYYGLKSLGLFDLNKVVE